MYFMVLLCLSTCICLHSVTKANLSACVFLVVGYRSCICLYYAFINTGYILMTQTFYVMNIVLFLLAIPHHYVNSQQNSTMFKSCYVCLNWTTRQTLHLRTKTFDAFMLPFPGRWHRYRLRQLDSSYYLHPCGCVLEQPTELSVNKIFFCNI